MRRKRRDGTYLDQSPVCPMCQTPVEWFYHVGTGKLHGRDADNRDHYPMCPVIVEKRDEYRWLNLIACQSLGGSPTTATFTTKVLTSETDQVALISFFTSFRRWIIRKEMARFMKKDSWVLFARHLER